jgi:hypothetical protein
MGVYFFSGDAKAQGDESSTFKNVVPVTRSSLLLARMRNKFEEESLLAQRHRETTID